MLGLKAALAMVALSASAAPAQTGKVDKLNPAASFARNLAAVSESMLRSKTDASTTCLSARQHRQQLDLRSRCTLQKPQPAGPQ